MIETADSSMTNTAEKETRRKSVRKAPWDAQSRRATSPKDKENGDPHKNLLIEPRALLMLFRRRVTVHRPPPVLYS